MSSVAWLHIYPVFLVYVCVCVCSARCVLPLCTQVRGFKPGWSLQDFQGEKILNTPSFWGEVKPSAPCRRFAACKRSLNVTLKSAFRQNYQPTFSPTVPLFAARISRVLWTWRHLAAEVGISKPCGEGVHGCTICLQAAVHLGRMLRALI
jgi:hypothetical protein